MARLIEVGHRQVEVCMREGSWYALNLRGVPRQGLHIPAKNGRTKSGVLWTKVWTPEEVARENRRRGLL